MGEAADMRKRSTTTMRPRGFGAPTTLVRHTVVAALSGFMVYAFYLSYGAWGVEPALWPDWREDHPLWRAFAHAAFVLLFLSLAVGPSARLWRPFARFLPWRRELGIWFAVLSLAHGYVIWDRWARWSVAGLFGFEYIDDLGSYILFRPEVAIMNLMGLVALPMILLLAFTSSDGAMRLLGPSWKWLHGALVHTVFYILMLRGILYLFLFFQFSPPNWRIYPPIWFLYVFLGLGLLLVVLQATAFAMTTLQGRRRERPLSRLQTAGIVGVAVLFVMPMALATATIAYYDGRVVKENPALGVRADPRGQSSGVGTEQTRRVEHRLAEHTPPGVGYMLPSIGGPLP
jgi:DMSO/TMAO reductase YedYZ heme-binding membrane subunit